MDLKRNQRKNTIIASNNVKYLEVSLKNQVLSLITCWARDHKYSP